MNKIYKVVYCESTGTWQVVSELAKGHTKSSSTGNGTEAAGSAFVGKTLGVVAAAVQTAFVIGAMGAMPLTEAHAATVSGSCSGGGSKFSVGVGGTVNNPTTPLIGGCINNNNTNNYPSVNGSGNS